MRSRDARGELLPEGIFENNDDGLREFAQYLAEHRNSHFSLLANVAEEGHIHETIPFLRGLFSDRVLGAVQGHVDAKRYLCPGWAPTTVSEVYL